MRCVRLECEFPTTETDAYLALANKMLLPRRVGAAMQEWLTDIFENAEESVISIEPIEETRKKRPGGAGALSSLLGRLVSCEWGGRETLGNAARGKAVASVRRRGGRGGPRRWRSS